MNKIQIKMLQSMLNRMGFTDAQGHILSVDGSIGQHTKAAIAKAKPVLKYIIR